jgi:tRNA threonylcarbamoyladenosine biosynthesis protein TsaB
LPTLLCIDTSTTACSVVLSRDGVCVAHWFENNGYNHDISLAEHVNQLLNDTGMGVHKLDAVAVCEGPGSYTGLRIGLAFAKGICFVSGKPLLLLNTLQVLAASINKENRKSKVLIPMIDARRMEVYAAAFDEHLNPLSETLPIIVETDSFQRFDKEKILFVGAGAEKTKLVLSHFQPKQFVTNAWPDAKNMIDLAEVKFQKGEFSDISASEPNYLKAFQEQKAFTHL